jgi:soluble lytic murein transglycosylase-like protein/outer membrane protein assembly factor BamD (BamD/ComL family)
MRPLLKITLTLFFSIFFLTCNATAKSLDIFNTLKAFSPVLPALGDKSYKLDHLEAEEIPSALKHYVTAWGESDSQEEKNLLVLAIGYLHYLNQDYKSAIQSLDRKIVGNFILEDFRINYLSLALQERGKQILEKQQYSKALDLFKRSEKLRMVIFRSYPDSPFYPNVPHDLAEVEYQLGVGYFQALNYRAAWQAFRRSLMREFSDNEEHELKVNLALAENYRSAGDLKNAADVYASLLRTTKTVEAIETARNFFRVHDDRLKKLNVDLEGLKIDTPLAFPVNNKTVQRPIARKKKKIVYKNERVKSFYESIDRDDPEASLKLGLEVLQNFPGIQEARGVIKILNHLLISFLRDHAIDDVVERITTLYPRKTLNSLAYSLWKEDLPDQAAVFYEKIIRQYPLDINACHKALFFLGRIAEDKGEYEKAVGHYEELIRKYDFGSFTTAALFKIPWVYRLQNKPDLARTHFIRLLKFHASPAYKILKATYPNASYQLAGQYWLAQTQAELGNASEKIKILKALAQKHPFDFYSVISQRESGFDLKQFLTQKAAQEVDFRIFGLGEIERKRLSRAEQLIAVGFRDHGVHELAQLSVSKENPAFSFYMAHLFKLGGDFQDAMRLSWIIVGNGNHDRLSRSVAEGLYPRAFQLQVMETLKHYDLDPFLVLSLMRQESAFNPRIISKANAIGLMQLMPKTADEVARSLGQEAPTEEQLKDPSNNVRLGIDYLNYLMVSFDRNMVYALAAYNAGPTKVKQWLSLRSNLEPLEFIEAIPYTETRNYVKKVLRNYAIYLTLYEDQESDRFKEFLRSVVH